MGFLNERFPVTISYGSAGGPEYNTSIVSMKSGREKRNINWTYPRHVYDAAVGLRKISDMYDVIAFFHISMGMGFSFRWKDWADYKSCDVDASPAPTDQVLEDADGPNRYQLRKTYTVGGYSRMTRIITLPVENTVVVAVGGTPTNDFTVDHTTGIVALTGEHISSYDIIAVDTAQNWVAVAGDQTASFTEDLAVEIAGSTGNDGFYTVDSAVYDGVEDRTEITLKEGVEDDTADGAISYESVGGGSDITAGFEFDVHCRFDTDRLTTDYTHYEAGSASIPVIEEKTGGA